MSIVSLQGVSHIYFVDPVISDISVAIDENTRVGLVGRNGSGKSTLFNIITGNLTPTIGQVHRAKGRVIRYLTQHPQLDESKTLFQTVWASRPQVMHVYNKLRQAEKLVSKDHSPEHLEQLHVLQTQMEALQGWSWVDTVRQALTHLNFPEELWDCGIADFSGGEKTRIELACTLLADWDLLLLDEPTNHLDFAMLEWLKTFLLGCGRAYIVISHDRWFLDAVTNKTWEIRQRRLRQWGGNYSTYEAERALQEDSQLKSFKRQQRFIKDTEAFIRKNMAGQKVSQAKSRLKMLEKLERIEAPQHEKTVKVRIDAGERGGSDVVVCQNLSFGYPGRVLAQDVNLWLHHSQTAALIGPNGCGKTTLFKLLLGQVAPLSGEGRTGAGLRIGYFDQFHTDLNDSLTVLDTIWELMPGEPKGTPLSWLGRFGFSGDITQSFVGSLSGGERSRLFLAKLVLSKPNFLLLDEPTNHLDIPTIEALEDALVDYAGSVLMISHDRRFIERTADKIWHFKNQTIVQCDHGLEDVFAPEEKQEVVKDKTEKPKPVKRVNTFKVQQLEQKIEELENQIEQNVSQIHQLQLKLGQKQTYANEQLVKQINDQVAKLQQEQAKLKQNLENAEIDWLAQSEGQEI